MSLSVLFLFMLTTTTFAQPAITVDPINQGIPIQPSTVVSQPTPTTTDPSGSPSAATGGIQTQSTGGGNVIFKPATPAEIDADSRIATRSSMDEAAVHAADNTMLVVNNSIGMGDWMLTRDPGKILDYKPVQDMNNMLRWAGIVVWMICIGLVLLKHVLGPFVSAEPAMLYLALPITFTAGLAGFFNRQLLLMIVTCVHALLGIIANGSLREAISPSMHIASLPPPGAGRLANEVAGSFAAPIVALVVAVVALLVVVKMWVQVAWLFIMSSVAPIYITTTGAPLLGRYGAQWWRSWFGTLIDPILTIAGLRIAAAGLGFLDGTQPLFTDQILTLILLVPILATPGWHAGSFGGNGVDFLFGMLLYRVLLRQHQQGPSPTPPWVPTILPNPANVPTGGRAGHGLRFGGGNAVSWSKTARWTPGGWTTWQQATGTATP